MLKKALNIIKSIGVELIICCLTTGAMLGFIGICAGLVNIPVIFYTDLVLATLMVFLGFCITVYMLVKKIGSK